MDDFHSTNLITPSAAYVTGSQASADTSRFEQIFNAVSSRVLSSGSSRSSSAEAQFISGVWQSGWHA